MGRMDAMGAQMEALEQSIENIMEQAGLEKSSSSINTKQSASSVPQQQPPHEPVTMEI